jgi:hypothetical protein
MLSHLVLGKGLTKGIPAQVREGLAERASRLQEQQQLPVFKAAALEASPTDYQARSRSPTPERKAPVVRFETSQVCGNGSVMQPPVLNQLMHA